MMANAFFAAATVLVAVTFYLLQACTFLIPYRRVLIDQYGTTIAGWAGVAFINLFAAFYVFGRTVFLKDTGDKLAHLEKQIRTGNSLAEDLTHRLHE